MITFFLFIIIIGKVFYIQVVDYKKLNKYATGLWSRNLPIAANRGIIYDRNGIELASNITTTSLVLIPNQINDKAKVAKDLSEILGVDYEEMYRHVSKKTSIERVHPEGRNLNYDIADKINNLNYEGVYLVKEAKRNYPYDTLLSHSLGFVGIDNQGLSGLELIYDKYLTGSDGSIKYFSDAKGSSLTIPQIYEQPTSGVNMTLTINYKFHEIAEYLSSNYDANGLLDDKIFLNDVYKDLITKNPFNEEDDELDKTKVIINPSIALNALLAAIKANNKEKVLEIIGVCRYNELWNEVLKRLDNKELSKKDYLILMDGLGRMIPDDDKSILMGCIDYINLINKYPIKEVDKKTDKPEEKEEGKDKSKGLVNPLDIIKKRRVKNRKEKKSLIQKFKDLKTWQKALVVAGGIGAVALVGVGIYHLVPGAIAAINNFIGNNHVDSNTIQPDISSPLDTINGVINNAKDITQNGVPAVTPDVVAPVASAMQTAPATVDFSSIGHGHQIFSDAYSAVSGNNPLVASEWFSNNPLGIFNTVTNEFLKLSSQQLHDPEILKNLAADPNNAMLFGNSMQDADGFISLSELVGEVIKGGKII